MSITLPQAKPASSTTIAILTENYGELPRGYKKFIGAHDGVTPPENVLRGTNHSIGVRSFLATSEILETAQSVDGLSVDLIPIADDEAGNFICLGVLTNWWMWKKSRGGWRRRCCSRRRYMGLKCRSI